MFCKFFVIVKDNCLPTYLCLKNNTNSIFDIFRPVIYSLLTSRLEEAGQQPSVNINVSLVPQLVKINYFFGLGGCFPKPL